MLRFYGDSPPHYLHSLQLGGVCPHCRQGSRFALVTSQDFARLKALGANELTASYSCELCLKSIPILWSIVDWPGSGPAPRVANPQWMVAVLEDFDFEYVPEAVQKEIKEALACLSVNAYSGFAALSRRAVQAICSDLGAAGSSRVEKQIDEMIELTGMDDGVRELAKQIMLTGHDGAHPHLPEVSSERTQVLLVLLRDLTYQIYTRPGKVREAAALRQQAILSR